MTDRKQYSIEWHKELNSTNVYLKQQIQENDLEEYSIICTEDQTKGKGQGINKWESEPGKNLTFSLLIKPTFIEIQKQFVISKAISLAIIKVLNSYKDGFSIKWPNDIYYENSKVAGILIENSLLMDKIGTSIIGIGLNVNQTIFTSDAPNPISLKQITNKEFQLEKLLKEILDTFDHYYLKLAKGSTNEIHEEYLKNLLRKKGFFQYKDQEGTFEAKIKGISSYGHLILETKDETEKTFAFKEVEYIF